MKKIKEAYASVGKYTKDGQEKNQYRTIGALFERPDGSLCLKLDAVPVTFDGWINFSDPKITQAKEALQKEDFDSEIPF